MTSRNSLQAALDTNPDSDTGKLISGTASTATITTGTEPFAPDQTAAFTVSATWQELGISADGVYLAGVHVRAADQASGTSQTIGKGRTLITLATSLTASSATVVMLTSQPSLMQNGVFADDHLAEELTGRLAALLTLAKQKDVAWVIDPGLLHELSVMAQGYSVWEDTSTITGTGQTDAQSWLDAFEDLDTNRGYRMPWGNPDLTLGTTVPAAVLALNEIDEESEDLWAQLPLLVRAGNGQIDDHFIGFVSALQPQILLGAVSANANLPNARVLNTLPIALPGGPGPDEPDTALHKTQRAIAEAAVSDTTLIRVIETEEDAELINLPPWVSMVGLELVTASVPWSADLSLGTPEGPLTTGISPTVRQTQTTMATYVSLIGSTTQAVAAGTRGVAAVLSQSWADDDQANQYAATLDAWIHELMAGVTMTASTEVSLTSRTSSFPVTVTNHLSFPVYVQIDSRVVPVDASPAILSIPRSEIVMIQPGKKMTIALSPTVTREGDVDAILRLTTPSGAALGSEVTVRILARASSWMGWVVVGSAVVLFGVGTYVRVRSARSKNGDKEVSDE